MKFFESENPISNEDLSEFESKWKLQLPSELKEVLLKFNGGFPEMPYFRGGEICFLPIKHGEWTMDKMVEMKAKMDHEFIKQYLPFAFFGGTYYCIGLGSGNGKIFWLLEDGELVEVADSFDSFMEELSDDEDY